MQLAAGFLPHFPAKIPTIGLRRSWVVKDSGLEEYTTRTQGAGTSLPSRCRWCGRRAGDSKRWDAWFLFGAARSRLRPPLQLPRFQPSTGEPDCHLPGEPLADLPYQFLVEAHLPEVPAGPWAARLVALCHAIREQHRAATRPRCGFQCEHGLPGDVLLDVDAQHIRSHRDRLMKLAMHQLEPQRVTPKKHQREQPGPSQIDDGGQVPVNV